jgi:hypothetical protein
LPEPLRRVVQSERDEREEVRPMPRTGGGGPTNEQIVRLLEEVKSELAQSKKRELQIARGLEQLLTRKAT